MVVPFAPGGASDIVGRIMAAETRSGTGPTVVIDNRAGASGNIGVVVAACEPRRLHVSARQRRHDGDQPQHFSEVSGRPVRDFIAVTEVVDVPGALACTSVGSREHGQGIRRICESAPGQTQFRFIRRRQRAAHGDGNLYARGRHRSRAHSVQGRRGCCDHGTRERRSVGSRGKSCRSVCPISRAGRIRPSLV